LSLSATTAVAAPPPAGDRTEAEVDYAYGLAALHGGDLEEAERSFESATTRDPDHGGAWYGLGLARLARGDGAGARQALERSRTARHPPPVAQGALDQTLERARDPAGGPAVPAPVGVEPVVLQRLPRWETRVALGAGSDSNPALLPEGLPAFFLDGTAVQDPASDTTADLSLRLEVHPFYDRAGWSLGLGIFGRRTLFDDTGTADFARTRALVSLAWGGDPLGYLTGPLGFTRVPAGHRRLALLLQGAATSDELDGRGFGDTREASATLLLRETRRLATQLDLTWRDQDFDAAAPALLDPQGRFSGEREEQTAGLSQVLHLGRRNGYLRVGAAAGTRDTGGAFDSDLERLAAELSAPLSRRVVFFATGRLEREDFDDLASNPLAGTFLGDRPREDETRRLAAALTFAVHRRLWVLARVTRIERDTELGAADAVLDLDYDRTVATVGLRWFVAGGRVER
jgi:hypothetical protein